MEEEILFFLSAFVAEIIGTMAGFGSSTIFLPLALFFVDFETAIVLVAIFHLFGNIGRISFFRQGFDKRIILQFGVPSVLLSLLGAFLIGIIPQPTLKLILGIFLIVTSGSFLAKPGLKFAASTGTFIAAGSATGFITALVGRSIVVKINQELFRKMVLVAIILVSIKFIVDGLLLGQ